MKNKPVFKSFIARADKKEAAKRKDMARFVNVQPKSWYPLQSYRKY